jgi:hypothetical protein
VCRRGKRECGGEGIGFDEWSRNVGRWVGVEGVEWGDRERSGSELEEGRDEFAGIGKGVSEVGGDL